jgi:hypothetical protein
MGQPTLAKTLPQALLAINSILAIPILRKGKVAAVLAMDSTFQISDTMFDDKRVIDLARVCARTLEPACFFDGVGFGHQPILT